MSSPIFYDYRTQAPKTKSDLSSSPNPILDSAFGTIILFDELWFLCESLCPQNLRGLPYVKYLDQFLNLEILDEINPDNIWTNFGGENQSKFRMDNLRKQFNVYREVVRKVGVNWDSAADNHTHGLIVGNNEYSGNSLRPDNIIFDLATVELLKKKFKKDIQLITNSFTQSWLDSPNSVLAKSKLTELLIIENIPNYLTQLGPYHPSIEEVRENEFLKSYRNWISDKKLKYDIKELEYHKREIENQLELAQKQIFLKYLDPKSTYKSIGKTVVGAIADNIIPFVSTVYAVGEEIDKRAEKMDIMWQGFIISAKQ